ncbi:hypothetical protein J437_LFUL011165 [Ladona fulva]|uniref:HAT C-terminal dimerisation domain-containing protein n=1 Tax=Ladona fulva TaxID=123851 RepID=A0A8K0NX09_LADFU|nr:hypothetical protein J437_LFUL011165 [Ladona fulva]
MVFNDFTVKEELLKILPLKKRTRGEDIYNIFKTNAAEIGLPLKKLSAITTDAASTMKGRTNGFAAVCKKDECFPNLMSHHFIHQEALCAKILPFGHVMDIVTSIINIIRAAPFQHRLFKTLLEDYDYKMKNSRSHLASRSPMAQQSSLEPVASLFVNPITIRHEATETATTTARIISSEVGNHELEIVDLKNDIILQAHATDVDFWKLVEKDRFPLLRSVAYKIKSCFRSTYLCESLFSTMNNIKSKNRSRLTDSHLESSLRAGTSACVPKMEALVDEIQCKKSH